MCLILFRFDPSQEQALIVAANRDEAYQRATARADFWQDSPTILAGRDLEAGGSWLGLNRSGNFAALTNFREPLAQAPKGPSRGHLVSDYLAGTLDAKSYLAQLSAKAEQYAGFNLLLGNERELWYFSNRSSSPRRLPAGYYSLCNGELDAPWPKSLHGKQALQKALAEGGTEDTLRQLLLDKQPFAENLPDTGVGRALELMLSPLFIRSEHYGTRSSSLVYLGQGQADFYEYNYPYGAEDAIEPRHFQFTYPPAI